jgi:hypothetical protein
MEEKEQVFDAIYRGINAFPHLRAGQIIDNACYLAGKRPGTISNKDLTLALIDYIKTYKPKEKK